MSANSNLLAYFFQAGPVVKSVMLLLLAASITSWTLIFQQSWFLSARQRQVRNFLKKFWHSKDVSTLFAQIDTGELKNEGLAAVFHKGFKTYVQMRKSGDMSVDAIGRVMMNQQAREAGKLSKHLTFFASVGSIAPYVGLFGTVWGIMTSLQALGNARQATIGMVAPGISEALVATALGLFTAIPAVMAYNRYNARIASIVDEYELFQNEFMSMIELQTKHAAEE